MAISQKRIYELVATYFPNLGDNLDALYIAVDGVVFGVEAQKMPLAILFDLTDHIEKPIPITTSTLEVEAEFGTAFSNTDYILDIYLTKETVLGGGGVDITEKPWENLRKTTTGFTIDTYETGLKFAYRAENR